MNAKKLVTATEIIISVALFIFIGYDMYLGHFVSLEAFLEYIREDGVVEYTTTIFLLFCSLVCIYRLIQYRKMKKSLWILTWAVLAFLFFFAAGDEISWGQRLFGIESGDFFSQHNKQAETNLHNLVVRGHNLNIVIFSRLMFLVLITYFIFSRLMFRKIAFIRNLVNKFQVPLPRIYHIIIMVAATSIILLIHLVRESELHELSFSMVFFMIFLNPFKNR